MAVVVALVCTPLAEVLRARRLVYGSLGCHPSSRLAFALQAPRISVTVTGPASPANVRSPISPVLRAWLIGVGAATPTKASRMAAAVREGAAS